MTERDHLSQLRQEIARLAAERVGVERHLLRRARMTAASLIERHLGAGERKRRSTAFYLSRWVEGRLRMTYVPKAEVEAVRARVEAWREWRAALRRWVELSARMERLWRELGRAQAEAPSPPSRAGPQEKEGTP